MPSTANNHNIGAENSGPVQAPSTERIGLGIQQGYRSASYQFLETRTPTDTLPLRSIAKLSNTERDVLKVKNRWLSSPFPAQLAAIVDRIIEDRRHRPITNAVCLGIGSLQWHEQFLVFSQVVIQLSVSNPEILNNIVVQVGVSPHIFAHFACIEDSSPLP